MSSGVGQLPSWWQGEAPKLKKWIPGALERSGKTVAQTLATGLLALDIGTLTDFKPIRNAIVVAVSAGVLSLLTSIVSVPVSQGLSFWENTLLRSGLTFVQSLVAVAVAAKPFNILTFHWPAALALSATAALTSVLTSLASIGSGHNAPAPPDGGPSPSLVKGIN